MCLTIYACASFSGRRLEALLIWYFPPFYSSIALGVKGGGDDRSSLKPYTDIYVEKGKEKKINSGDMMECQRPGIINVYASGSSLSSC